jgi:hypothetical protein
MERIAERHRMAHPCWGFEALSKSVLICECGHDEDAHMDRAHAYALEMDAERSV